MTMKTIDDPVPWVFAHPELYFKTAKPNELELAQSVWMDATLSGSGDVLVHHDDAVWVVAASTNWLTEESHTALELFERVVPLAAAGPNSVRSEILLNAFCSEVIALVGGTTVFAKGNGTVKSVLDAVVTRWGLAAAVGFRL